DKYDVLKNQASTFEINNKELNEQLNELIETNNDLLAQTKLLKEQLQVKHVVIDTHAECQEKYAKLEAKRYEYMIRYSTYLDNDKQHRKQIADQEVLKGIGFENPSYFEKAKDLRPTLYNEKVISLGYTLMFLTHSDEALEIKKFKRSRESKIEFAYDYGNLNASYQTSSLKPYIPNVILEKIIIDLEDEVVNLLEKEKLNMETIESLKSKGFKSSENVSSESENQSKNDCLVVEKECDKEENPKVISPGMFKLNVSQCVSPILMSKSSCESNNVEIKLKRKRRKRKSSKQNVKQVDNDVSRANSDFVYFSNLDTSSSVRRPKNSGVIWKKKGSSNTSNVGLSAVEAITTACFTQNRSIIHKRFDKTPYELINKRKNIKFFRVFGCRCYLLNDYEDVGKLKAKGDIRVFVGYSKESAAFRIYNKRTHKIHESVNVNFDEISEMDSKKFSLEPGLSNLKETGKSSNPSVSQVSEVSKKDLEDLFQDFYDEYFDSSKIMKSLTTNVETSINEEVFHEVSESFQRESSSSSLNDDVQQSPEEVILPQTNTLSISNNMVPNGDEASTSHNVFNERLEDAYFDASTSFHDTSNVHTYYQPYPHEKKWSKDHPLHKIIGDPKSSVRTRGQLANLCLFLCLLSSIKPANVAEALRDANWVSVMQEELDQFARLKVWRLVPRP
nr:hypothetical protein [Tanacetum cinerariifolium]